MNNIANGQFLALSRAHQNGIAPFTYTLDNGVTVEVIDTGIIVLTPAASVYNKAVVLSCGVHGNETAPIEICDQLLQDILNQQCTLKQRVMFMFGNLPAMDIAERFVEENLNRLFSKTLTSQSAEGRRAKVLMQALEQFFEQSEEGVERFHYDLHTAIRASKNEKFAVYPFLHGKPYSKTQLAFLSACGVNTVLLSQSATTTFSYFSSLHYNAHAFTVELGKVQPFGQNDMQKFSAVTAQLRALVSQDSLSLPDFESCPMELFNVAQVINKHADDFCLHFADNIPNFTDFPVGTVLASETGAQYRTQQEGEAIVFPNANVALGQRAILTVVPCEL